MDISIRKDDGSIYVYDDLPGLAQHFVVMALLDLEPAAVIPAQAVAPIIDAIGSAVANHAPKTGACMCPSFRQQRIAQNGIARWQCPDCGHETHNTRTHCGALR